MSWKKVLGYAILFWLIMFVVACIFVGFKVGDFLWVQIIMWVVAIIVAWLLAGAIGVNSLKTGLIVGISFVVIGLILDFAITARFTGMGFFSDWHLWVSYGLGLLVPVIRGMQTKNV